MSIRGTLFLTLLGNIQYNYYKVLFEHVILLLANRPTERRQPSDATTFTTPTAVSPARWTSQPSTTLN